MFQVNVHFPNDHITIEFESEYAFIKWLGYLNEHGLASAKMAGGGKNVTVFRSNLTYIETESSVDGLGLH